MYVHIQQHFVSLVVNGNVATTGCSAGYISTFSNLTTTHCYLKKKKKKQQLPLTANSLSLSLSHINIRPINNNSTAKVKWT